MKRKDALLAITYCGYHGDADWARIYVENRVSYEAAREAYRAGARAKERGVPCGCAECAQKQGSATT